jgi:hypothetical protein
MMKAIINRKLYNTETAEELGNRTNGCSSSDFNYVCETLYRKHNGEFFLLGNGGARSKYSRTCEDGSWMGGTTIIPLTLNEAQKWAEEYLDADDYMLIFGLVFE